MVDMAKMSPGYSCLGIAKTNNKEMPIRKYIKAKGPLRPSLCNKKIQSVYAGNSISPDTAKLM